MAKLKKDPISREDIERYLRSSDDFQLEMRVLQSCFEHRFTAAHGGTYQDPATKKDRQFDIRAILRRENYILRFAVECKNLGRHYPLIVSRVPRLDIESRNSVILSRSARGQISAKSNLRLFSGSNSMFRPREMVGKSTIQIGKSEVGDFVTGDSDVYEKWAQAVASAQQIVEMSATEHELMAEDWVVTNVLPILVVSDDSLWAADYDTRGNLESLGQVETVDFYLGKTLLGKETLRYWLSHLKIFTESGFRTYLDRVLDPEEVEWDRLFPIELRDIARSF